MSVPFLPNELLERIMWNLRPSIGPTRGLDYAWHGLIDDSGSGLYSNSSALVNKKQQDDKKTSRRTLASCMRANSNLRKLAQAVYYETVDVDQLFPFVQRCICQPGFADHVRELYVSGQNGYLYPERALFDSDGTSGHDSFRSRMLAHGVRDDFNNGQSEISVAMMAIILCTKLQKIVVEQNAVVQWVLPETLLEDCAALFKSNKSSPSRIPLSNLRTLAIQAPSRTDQKHRRESRWWDDEHWFQLLSGLPKIGSIEITGGDLPVWYDEGFRSNLRSLTVVDLPITSDGATIRRILSGCPALECLDLTAPPRDDGEYDQMETWSGIGEIVSRHGGSLRKFRYDNIVNQTRGLLNVSALRNLRYLAVPVDALMNLVADHENEEVSNGNRHGFGSAHDIEDMWAETTMDDSDASPRDGDEVAGQDDEEEWPTRSILASSNVPFSHLFPDTLQHLRILDDVGSEKVARHVDRRLRDLVLDPRFSELCDVQVRRKTVFTEHVRDIGWHIERRSFWNIMRRT
jgi:hypothetical protein